MTVLAFRRRLSIIEQRPWFIGPETVPRFLAKAIAREVQTHDVEMIGEILAHIGIALSEKLAFFQSLRDMMPDDRLPNISARVFEDLQDSVGLDLTARNALGIFIIPSLLSHRKPFSETLVDESITEMVTRPQFSGIEACLRLVPEPWFQFHPATSKVFGRLLPHEHCVHDVNRMFARAMPGLVRGMFGPHVS